MEEVITKGVSSLMNLGPLVTLLLLVILGQFWIIKCFIKDAKDERTLNRDALMNNTAVISEFKELIRGAIAK